MNTTTYAETPVYMHPVVLGQPLSAANKTAAPGTARASAEDVRELLDAAGPLTLANIAGGLDVSPASASSTVEWMLSRGDLRIDEWNRLRLSGAHARAA